MAEEPIKPSSLKRAEQKRQDSEREAIIPVKEESLDEESYEGFTIEPLEETPDERINRRLLAPNTARPGRSIKLRDIFLLSGCVKSSGTLTTLNNFTSQTELSSVLFLRDEFHVGMVIRMTAMGYYSTVNGTDLLTFEVGWGEAPSISPVMQTVLNTAATVTDAPWNLEFVGIVTAIGSSGKMANNLRANINRVNKDNRADAATFSTLTTKKFSLAASWSSADASNSVSINTFVVEVLN